jgi:hypothetical protein
MRKRASEAEATIAGQKAELDDRDQKIERLMNSIERYSAELLRAQNERGADGETIEGLHLQLETVSGENEALLSALVLQQQQIDDLAAQKKSLENAASDLMVKNHQQVEQNHQRESWLAGYDAGAEDAFLMISATAGSAGSTTALYENEDTKDEVIARCMEDAERLSRSMRGAFDVTVTDGAMAAEISRDVLHKDVAAYCSAGNDNGFGAHQGDVPGSGGPVDYVLTPGPDADVIGDIYDALYASDSEPLTDDILDDLMGGDLDFSDDPDSIFGFNISDLQDDEDPAFSEFAEEIVRGIAESARRYGVLEDAEVTEDGAEDGAQVEMVPMSDHIRVSVCYYF